MSFAHNPLSLVWLRRDLRLYDHATLHAALAEKGVVQHVFIFDTEILARFTNPRDRRVSFIAEALCTLDKELSERGSGLLVLFGRAQEVMPKLVQALAARQVFAGEDYEPATIARDGEIANMIALTLVKDHLIFAPGEIIKADGKPFKIYTSYARAWFDRVKSVDFAEYPINDAGRYAKAESLRTLASNAGLCVLPSGEGPAAMLAKTSYQYRRDDLWSVNDARVKLKRFVRDKMAAYGKARDIPAREGTSRISPALRFGLLSIREAFRLAEDTPGNAAWLSELVWREFYAMILFHCPESAREEWNPEYRGTLEWSDNAEHLEAWKKGMTGYPIVDAAMRELLQTGWMHNRARMIVASFLTKDLQIDWRLGEEHFAQVLMDYELASNVGGWQWAASTGTDAQPYFRVFNPVLQSQKFDPEGEYIVRYVQELSGLPPKELHEPWKSARGTNYPAPIVDHAKARQLVMAMFKKAKKAA